jgi:hypothetical protein
LLVSKVWWNIVPSSKHVLKWSTSDRTRRLLIDLTVTECSLTNWDQIVGFTVLILVYVIFVHVGFNFCNVWTILTLELNLDKVLLILFLLIISHTKRHFFTHPFKIVGDNYAIFVPKFYL